MAVLVLLPSCRMFADYAEAGEDLPPVVVGAGVGASVGGPIGAGIGAGIGCLISVFRHKVQELRAENKDLREGNLYGRTTAHELVLPGGAKLQDVLPWYFNPWTIGKLVLGWAIAIFLVSVLIWRFGHPALRWLRGLLTLGIAPALGKLRAASETKAYVRKNRRYSSEHDARAVRRHDDASWDQGGPDAGGGSGARGAPRRPSGG